MLKLLAESEERRLRRWQGGKKTYVWVAVMASEKRPSAAGLEQPTREYY
jgi:hypothetical protein